MLNIRVDQMITIWMRIIVINNESAQEFKISSTYLAAVTEPFCLPLTLYYFLKVAQTTPLLIPTK